MTTPEPLVPADCDCRGLTFMPLEVSRLLDSDFAALSTGEEFKAGLILWAKAWTQVPAASVPDDDRILARLVGMSLSDWLRVKEMALHNWIKCSDGRLYHPVIADLAAAAVVKRKGQSARANTRWAKVRAAKAAAEKNDALGMPPHDEPDATARQIDAQPMQGTVEVEDKEPPLPPLGDEQRSGRSRPKSSIPHDFPVADLIAEQQAKAREAGADVDVAYQAERFRNWAIGKDAKYADWPATWRNWMLKAIREAPQRFATGRPVSATSTSDPWPSRIANYRRNAFWNRLDWGPPPGKPGCTLSPEVQMAHGYTPAAAQPLNAA